MIEIETKITTVVFIKIAKEVVNVTEITTEIATEAEADTIRVHHHIHATEAGAAKELTMNLKIKIIVKSTITAWPIQLYFANNKEYLPLKTLFEHLQSGNYLRGKKKKTNETSSQGS